MVPIITHITANHLTSVIWQFTSWADPHFLSRVILAIKKKHEHINMTKIIEQTADFNSLLVIRPL